MPRDGMSHLTFTYNTTIVHRRETLHFSLASITSNFKTKATQRRNSKVRILSCLSFGAMAKKKTGSAVSLPLLLHS